jgi:hypothetical protein
MAGTGWSDRGVQFALLVNILGGLFLGYAIGFVPIMFQYNTYLADCGRYTSPEMCGSLTVAGCVWVHGQCEFPDYAAVNCSAYSSQDSCKQKDACYWRYHDSDCAHGTGWTANQQGVLAGAQILGAMASSPLAGPGTNVLGRRLSVAVSGRHGDRSIASRRPRVAL